jgi:hypothetical protein
MKSSINSASVKKSHQKKFSNAEMMARNVNAKELTSLPSKPQTTVLNSPSKRLTNKVNSSSVDPIAVWIATPTLSELKALEKASRSNASAIKVFITSTTIEERDKRGSIERSFRLHSSCLR